MQKIQIETSQNVAIEYELASIGDRVLAQLLDSLILAGYLIVLFLLMYLLRLSDGFFGGLAFWIILYLPVFFYDLLLETFFNGQSFGKKIRKIKVVKIDGTQPTFISYFLRWILKPVDVFFTYGSIGIITILIGGKGQRLGDLAAGTTIIKIRNDANLNQTIFTNVSENYQPAFPQVTYLSDREIELVKEALEHNTRLTDLNTYDRILEKVKDAVAKKAGISTTMTTRAFLRTILKDYNSINGR
ncbi:MAG: RDD family protein [Ignavibacteria bacterium]